MTSSSSATKTLSIFCWLALLSLVNPSISRVDARPTVYEVLQQFNFPEGIIPNNVKDYDLDEKTGHFNVYLDGECSFSLDKYKLTYESVISGDISNNTIDELDGVWAKTLFFKLKIEEVDREGDQLTFHSGLVSAHVGADHIPRIPQCGCGFSCSSPGPVYSFNPNPVHASAGSISMLRRLIL